VHVTTQDESMRLLGRPTQLVLMVILVVGCLLGSAWPARAHAAEVQVSELFRETARALARYGLERSLAKACKAVENGNQEDELRYDLCIAFTSVLQDLAIAAIEGELDEEFALSRFATFQHRAVLAAAMYAFRTQLAEVLLGPLRKRLSQADQRELDEAVVKATSCLAGLLLERATLKSCRNDSSAASPSAAARQALAELEQVTKPKLSGLPKPARVGYDVALTLVQDATLAALGSSGTLQRVRTILRVVDEKAGWQLGRLEANVALDADEIRKASDDLERYSEAQCPAQARTRLLTELTTLANDPLAVWTELGRRVSHGQPPPRAMLPGGRLGACTLHPGAYETHVHFMDLLISSAQLHARLIRWRPMLLSAALFIEQLARPNEQRLRRDASGLIADVAYTILAGRIGARLVCEEADVDLEADRMTIACKDVDSQRLQSYVFEGRQFEATELTDGNAVISKRLTQIFTVAAARGTCVGQLVGAAMAGDRVETFGALGPVCVLDPAFEEAERRLIPAARRLGLALEPVAPVVTQPASGRRLMRWSDDSVDPGVDSVRLRLSSTTATDFAREAAMLLATAYMGSSNTNATTAGELIEALASQLADDAPLDPAVVYTLATNVLAEPVKGFVEALFDREDCDEPRNSKTVRCLVGNLAVGLYEPLLRYSAGELGGNELLHEATRAVDRLDPLGHSPLFLSFGLAYSGALPLTDGSDQPLSHHLTVIDKWGLVHRFGRRNEWHVGGFVGGFIDALVRTALDGSARSYWLAPGVVFGARQIWKAPFGLEAHFAGAPRADFRGFGIAFGAALTVPFELLLRDR
jgi:hypothetical protein